MNKPCPTCKGTGTTGPDLMPCTRCRGKGYTNPKNRGAYRKRENREAYIQKKLASQWERWGE